MLDFKNIIEHSDYEFNEFYLNRYWKFIRYCEFINNKNDLQYGYEIHHILPRSMFKEYERNNDNLIKLSIRQHFVAHLILLKMFRNRFMAKALFMFKSRKGAVNSREYECLKKLAREKLKGFKHKESTKKLMSEHSIKGKHAYNNGEITKFLYEPTEEFNKLGHDPYACEIVQKGSKDMVWYYNEETGKTIRIKEDKNPPEGFVRKRVYNGKFVGFSKINDPNKISVFDIRDKKKHLIDKKDINTDYQISGYGPCHSNLNIIVLFDNFYFTGIFHLKRYLKSKYDADIPLKMNIQLLNNIQNKMVIKRSKTSRGRCLKFYNMFNNKTYDEVFQAYELNSFKCDYNYKLWNERN